MEDKLGFRERIHDSIIVVLSNTQIQVHIPFLFFLFFGSD